MDKIIRVRAAGGLGNQLLQYFGALFLSQELRCRIRFDLTQIDKSHTFGMYDIRSFMEPSKNLLCETYPRYSLKNLYLKVLRRLGILFPFRKIILQLQENQTDFFDLVRQIQNESRRFCIIEIRGWFGNFDYFSALSPDLRKLSLKSKTENFIDYEEQLINKDYVAVHLRFGDYFNNPSSYGILTKDYYERAFESLNVSLSNELVVVFSNDNSKINDFIDLKRIKHLIVVNDDPNFDPAEVLVLMSQASKLILSNSTFSYLSGLLSSPESMVAFPRYNVKGQEFIKNTPDNWVEINPDWL